MLPTTLRDALLSIAVFLPAHVLADDDDSSDVVTFQFSACVSTCLGNTGYSMDGEDNQKEMCKASRDGLLEAIIACTVSNCLEDFAAIESTLLQPMQTGCKKLEKPVSDDEIEDAANAAVNIQITLAASTSTSTTSSSSTEPAVTTSIDPNFQPLGVETEMLTAPYLPATTVPVETPAPVEPAVEATAPVPAPTTVTVPIITDPEPIIPVETQTSTSELVIPSETQPPPEPVTSAEPSSMTLAAIVPVAQITDISPEQPAPEPTTAAEPPSDPAPSPQPASASTSTAAGDHANKIQPENTLATTIAKPTSTDNAKTQAQPTTALGQAANNASPVADATTSTQASKTEGHGSKATHTDAGEPSSSHDSDDDEEGEDSSSSETSSTATADISGELVLATGTPTASSASGFATSVVTAVTASPSASGTGTASSDDVDDGLGGGSPFSVVMASAALRSAPCWWASLFATMGMFASLML